MIIPDFDFITTLLNVHGEEIESCDVLKKDDAIHYVLTLRRKPLSCPYCGSPTIGHGHKKKTINSPALREYRCVIDYNANRYLCKTCSKTFLEENRFAFEGFNSSYLLLRSVMKMLGNLSYTIDMIAKELSISPTQVNKYLDSFITIPAMSLPECLGIDEIHNPEMAYKGSAYLCVLTDNENRCIHDVLGSRSKSYLDNYFYAYKDEEKARVKYVTIDMWEPYRDLAYKHFKNCIVAIDPFHVVEHLCKDFRQVRINIMNQCEYGSNAYYLLKKWNWMLEADRVDLDNEPVYNSRFGCKLNRRQILKMMLEISPRLEEAYVLKEKYRSFNRNTSYEEAVEKYDVLLQEFEDSGIAEYREFIGILHNWRKEILNSFRRPYDDHKLSNAFTENINGRINTYLNISKGISNFKRFRKRLMYALNPKIFYSLTNILYSDKREGKKRGPYRKAKE